MTRVLVPFPLDEAAVAPRNAYAGHDLARWR